MYIAHIPPGFTLDNRAEAQKLEKAGQLAEARSGYSESQALIEVKDVTEALKRLDEEIHRRVKITLNDSRKLYDSQKYKEAADALEDSQQLPSARMSHAKTCPFSLLSDAIPSVLA